MDIVNVINQSLGVWGAISRLFQGWLLSPTPLLSLVSSLNFIYAVVILSLGLLATVFGGRTVPFRIMAVLVGLLMGWTLGGIVAGITGISSPLVAYGIILGMAVIGGFSPCTLFSFPVALFAGVITYEATSPMVAMQSISALGQLGATMGAALIAGMFVFFAEKITTVVSSSLVGGLSTVIGLLAVFNSIGMRLALFRNFAFIGGFILVITVFGVFVQYRYIAGEDDRTRAKIMKAKEVAKKREDKERLKRFEKYGQPGGR